MIQSAVSGSCQKRDSLDRNNFPQSSVCSCHIEQIFGELISCVVLHKSGKYYPHPQILTQYFLNRGEV